MLERVEKLETLLKNTINGDSSVFGRTSGMGARGTRIVSVQDSASQNQLADSKVRFAPLHQVENYSEIFTKGAQPLPPQPVNDPVVQEEFVGRVRDANFALTKELDQKNREIERLKKQLESRELNIGEYATGFRLLKSNEDMLKSEIDLLKKENQILE